MTVKAKRSIIVLISLHVVGILGMLSPLKHWFVALTPVNLLITSGLVLWNHREFRLSTAWMLLLAYFVGLGIEIIGVATGVIFGEYKYGIVLGPKLAGAPMVIGVNWVILLFVSGELARWMFRWVGWRMIAGAFSMVLLDILIEPVALSLEWWAWTRGVPPLMNYVGWFLVSLSLHAVYAWTLRDQRNDIGSAVFAILFGFFVLLNIALV